MHKITAEDVVHALKRMKLSSQARDIARFLGMYAYVVTDSRAVATAMRQPVKDGRVTITYRKGIGHYRFKRLTPNCGISGS